MWKIILDSPGDSTKNEIVLSRSMLLVRTMENLSDDLQLNFERRTRSICSLFVPQERMFSPRKDSPVSAHGAIDDDPVTPSLLGAVQGFIHPLDQFLDSVPLIVTANDTDADG